MSRRAHMAVVRVMNLLRTEAERVPWTWRWNDDPRREAILWSAAPACSRDVTVGPALVLSR